MTAAGGWFHCSVKTMSRSTGRSAVAAAAYRLGERLHELEVDQTHDYRRRSGVAVTFTCAPSDAPAWAHDPERLWNAANAAEKRKNSTLAREVELALPATVSAEAREGIARTVAQELVNRYGVAVSGAIHAPSRDGDQRNHHVHLLFTTRRMEPDGLGPKTRVLDAKATGPQEVSYLRAFACDAINAALSDAGSDERVDHRSFAARGIEEEPTTHLGPAGTALERRAEQSERGLTNYEIVGGNQRFHELVDELAVLNAEIAAEQERQLDARVGEAEPDAPTDPAPGGLPVVEPDAGVVPIEVIRLGSQMNPQPSEQEPPLPGATFTERAMRALTAFFEVAGTTPAPPPPPEEPSSEPLEAHAAAPDVSVEPLPAPSPDVAVIPSAAPPTEVGDFDAVHNRTISQAHADMAVIDAEEAGGTEGRFGRARAWWTNMREHFVEWRDQFQDRVESFRTRWSEPETTHDEGPGHEL